MLMSKVWAAAAPGKMAGAAMMQSPITSQADTLVTRFMAISSQEYLKDYAAHLRRSKTAAQKLWLSLAVWATGPILTPSLDLQGIAFHGSRSLEGQVGIQLLF
jgi:hypothetical protein